MCLEWIKGLDMFGKKVELQIEGRSSFKTYFGAVVTVIFLSFITTVSLPTFLEYLSTDQPGLIGESYKRSLYPEINLHTAKHLPFLIAYSNEVDLIPFESMKRYFTFTVEKIMWKESGSNGVLGYQKEIIYTEPVPCGSLSKEELANYDYLEKHSFLEDLLMHYAICMPASSNLTVIGKGTDPEFVVISFKIKPCSLPGGVGCASEQELGKANFMWINPINALDSANYAQPRSKHANADDIYYINPSIRQMYVAKFKENVVLDLKGIFDPQPSEKVRYFDIEDVFATNAFRKPDEITCEFAHTRRDDESCYSYFEYSFQSSGAIFNYKRSYKTLRDTLGEIGGLIEVIILASLILVSPVVDWQYSRHIQKKVFQFTRDKRILPYFEAAESPAQKTSTAVALKSRNTWCCKKTLNKSKESNLKSAIQKTLDQKLDVINFIQDLNVLSLLSKVYLQQHHLKLAPFANLTDHLPDGGLLSDKQENIVSGKTSDSLQQFLPNSHEGASHLQIKPSPSASNSKCADHSNRTSSARLSEYEQLMFYTSNQAKNQIRKPSKVTRQIQKVPDDYFFKLLANRPTPINSPPVIPLRIPSRKIRRMPFAQIDQHSLCLGEASREEKTDRL